MIIYGRNDQEHDQHLVTFLDVCRKNTLTLKPRQKCSSDFHKFPSLDTNGEERVSVPDPKKIAAVNHMELPRDMGTMRSFLGLVNYLKRFSPCLAELSEPLRQVCRQNVEFELTESVCVAFSKDKRGNIEKHYTSIFQSSVVLPLCRPMHLRKDLVLVLLQNSKPVMFTSRALTGSERNYQNLQRECLATIWGMEKFHYFLYGKEFTLKTNQKPSSFHLQETHGGDFSKDPEIDCQKAFHTSHLMCSTRKA